MKVLLTGAAGFIGYHVAEALLSRGALVAGVDDLNPYYDVRLKHARLDRLAAHDGFRFHRVDIADHAALRAVGDDWDVIVHLAAQAGVRYSIDNPFAYAAANLVGHLSVLEVARHVPRLKHLVYASSSSVYGAGTPLPYAETARADRPQSLYAATKRADELMSAAYAHLYGIRQTGLRFFTVYGPWGRPDMAYFGFAEAIMAGRPITLYEAGTLKRDFTYIDDIVEGVMGVIEHAPAEVGAHRIFNIGNHRAEFVRDLVQLLEEELGRKAVIVDASRPPADPVETCADLSALAELTGFAPKTNLNQGIKKFVSWYRIWCAERG
ncbi:polysaccharide biosynthesis protein [Acidiphilium multivorum AIU301]|uniref:Polysaccharide biosynthesis protein n=1 Tax=Acidiphilium multivorum (strain DSM 11245 / JCM 8867 / NBRC 100883 / AIU 301) TaxID=926570 RepID=F0J380_ACIMA|nr:MULTISPECIES: NAD-dependent epimerase/dehydratase family protein [Acidiphilium]MDE1990290.1 NAD-dependent epimerase/dehydratase family protein [Betaproteobacteria bacterium]BAJ82026.1 polysaccharide biosynthesis protein [Acidiphilium multivorum AIU301]GAN75313.1 UDP-N-acetylglucosamine 4-epimerase [Acidiphilium multivorum AIU301]